MEMSEIHNLIALPDTPDGSRALLNEFVQDFESQDSIAWNKEVKSTDKKYHCHTLLKKGIGEVKFTNENTNINLSRKEISILLNYYYFPILFESTFIIYNKIWDNKFEKIFANNNALIFVDLGSDMLASSIAFSQVFKNNVVTESIWEENKSDNFAIISYILISDSNLSSNKNDLFIINNETVDSQNPDSQFEYKIFNLSEDPIWPSHEHIVLDIFEEAKFSYYADKTKKIDVSFFDLKKKLYNKLIFINEYLNGKFPTFRFIENFNNNKCFIVNINYLDSIRLFSDESIFFLLERLLNQNIQNDFAIIYQNNGNIQFQDKWDLLKSKLSIRSIDKGFINLKTNNKIRIDYEILYSKKFEHK